MAKANSKDKEEVRQENIDQKVSVSEQFLKKNKKIIWYVVGAVVIIGLAILAYNKFVYQPKCVEAMQQAYPAENSFRAGEYELALNGDGNNLGFADIIKEYGSKAGMSVYLYAGISELQLGKFEEAAAYLRKYKGSEPILAARAKACEGDAQVGLKNYDAAIKCFKAAVAKADNVFAATYLVKEGLAYEALGNKADALACYVSVRDNYPQSIEAYEINKYIARVSE